MMHELTEKPASEIPRFIPYSHMLACSGNSTPILDLSDIRPASPRSSISFVQMIYPAQVDAHSAAKLHSNMNFNLLPALRRPTDFSVNSILGNADSASGNGVWPAARLAPGLPPAHSKLSDMFAAEMMQQQLSMRAGLDNSSQPPVPTEPTTPSSASGETCDDAQVELEGMDLWEQFHDIGTEMVITKCGR